MKAGNAVSVLVASVLVACAGQSDRLVDSSGSRPGWVSSDKDSWQENDKIYYRGFVDRQAKLDMAVDRAKFSAIRKINESVYTTVVSSFGETSELISNDVDNPSAGQEGSFIKRELSSISKAVNLMGVTQEASYWEKFETAARSQEEQTAYKAYSLVSIPQKSLRMAQLSATQAGLEKLNTQLNGDAKASALKSLDDLKKQLSE